MPMVNDDLLEEGVEPPQYVAYDFTFNSPLSGTGTVDFGIGAFVNTSVGGGQTFNFSPYEASLQSNLPT